MQRRQSLRGRRRPAKKFWLSFNVQQDVGIISGNRNVCGTATAMASDQYTCLEEQGLGGATSDIQYGGIPDPTVGNAINGGFKLATTRLLIGLDFLVSNNITVGARLGYGLNVYAPARRRSREKRASPIGSEANRSSRRAFDLPGGDGWLRQHGRQSSDVPIAESAQTGGPQRRTTAVQTLQVWRKSGPVSPAGGGVMIPTGKAGGLLVELKLEALFPNSGFALSPSIGYAIGL